MVPILLDPGTKVRGPYYMNFGLVSKQPVALSPRAAKAAESLKPLQKKGRDFTLPYQLTDNRTFWRR